MSYYYSKKLTIPFDEAIEHTKSALKKEGFGVLTEINVKATLKKKLDVDFKPYLILGACNPVYAHKALSAVDKIGVMLPCNVLVIDQGTSIEVAAVEPVSAMMGVNSDKLGSIANEITAKLHQVIDSL